MSEGETITIARAGTPIAKLVPLEAAGAPSRLGFLAGERRVPDDLDTLGAEEIAEELEEPALRPEERKVLDFLRQRLAA